MLIEVKARELLPGDILCTDVSSARETSTEFYATEWTSRWNSAKLQSKSFLLLWELAGGDFRSSRHVMNEWSRLVEHVSYGPWKARIVMPGGVVIRLPRNTVLAVYRGGAE